MTKFLVRSAGLVLFCLNVSPSFAQFRTESSVSPKSCVEEIGYPATLRIPAVERWSTTSLVSTGTAETECQLARELGGLFGQVQEALAVRFSNDHTRLRGTHAKGLCFSGSFTPKIPSSLTLEQKYALSQTGLFSQTNALPADFRFANAASKIEADYNADVRAVSIKVKLPNGSRQDFAMNNVPRFQIGNLVDFVHLMEVSLAALTGEIESDQDGQPTAKGVVDYLTKRYGTILGYTYAFALKTIKNTATEDLKFHASYADQVYWTTTAFTVGRGTTIAKFGALPCAQATTAFKNETALSTQLKGESLATPEQARAKAAESVALGVATEPENFLGQSLVTQVKKAPVCYNLFVQFLDEEKTSNFWDGVARSNLVENPTVIWDGPVHIVGEIQVRQPVDQTTCDDPKNAVSVINNETGLDGLGQINRAREFAESLSWRNR